MLHPSYSELMDKINSEADKDNMIESRYSIVMAAADRAREIIESRSIEEKIAKQLKNDPTATPELSLKKSTILRTEELRFLAATAESH